MYFTMTAHASADNESAFSDIFVLIIESSIWGEYEEHIIKESKLNNTPVIVVVNKSDMRTPDENFIAKINSYTEHIIILSSTTSSLSAS